MRVHCSAPQRGRHRRGERKGGMISSGQQPEGQRPPLNTCPGPALRTGSVRRLHPLRFPNAPAFPGSGPGAGSKNLDFRADTGKNGQEVTSSHLQTNLDGRPTPQGSLPGGLPFPAPPFPRAPAARVHSSSPALSAPGGTGPPARRVRLPHARSCEGPCSLPPSHRPEPHFPLTSSLTSAPRAHAAQGRVPAILAFKSQPLGPSMLCAASVQKHGRAQGPSLIPACTAD